MNKDIVLTGAVKILLVILVVIIVLHQHSPLFLAIHCYRDVDLFSLVAVLVLLATCPLMVFYFHMACTHHDCALTSPILGLVNGDITFSDILNQLPPVTPEGFKIVFIWVTFQVRLVIMAQTVSIKMIQLPVCILMLGTSTHYINLKLTLLKRTLITQPDYYFESTPMPGKYVVQPGV